MLNDVHIKMFGCTKAELVESVEGALYEITEEQLKNADWHSATLIPETEW